jgi:hypothetical protein
MKLSIKKYRKIHLAELSENLKQVFKMIEMLNIPALSNALSGIIYIRLTEIEPKQTYSTAEVEAVKRKLFKQDLYPYCNTNNAFIVGNVYVKIRQ